MLDQSAMVVHVGSGSQIEKAIAKSDVHGEASQEGGEGTRRLVMNKEASGSDKLPGGKKYRKKGREGRERVVGGEGQRVVAISGEKRDRTNEEEEKLSKKGRIQEMSQENNLATYTTTIAANDITSAGLQEQSRREL